MSRFLFLPFIKILLKRVKTAKNSGFAAWYYIEKYALILLGFICRLSDDWHLTLNLIVCAYPHKLTP